MKTRNRIFLVGLLVAVLGVFAWLVLRQSREPDYQGRPLTFWLAGYDEANYLLAHPGGPSPPTRGQADEAIRQIGTNAIPLLLGMLQQHESKTKVAIMRLLQRQNFIKFRFALESQDYKAYCGFTALGIAASNAVPRLIAIFERDPAPLPQLGIPVIWGYMGVSAGRASPVLFRHGLTHTNALVRNNSIHALRQIHADAKLVVPAMIESLKDPDEMVRAQAVRTLGAFGKNAEAAVPALVELWRKEPPPVRFKPGSIDGTAVGTSWGPSQFSWGPGPPDVAKLAMEALQSIDPEAAAKAGIKGGATWSAP